jgi:SNF2 family DNA or RNA helicase
MQAIARCYRNGQTRKTKALLVRGRNSLIESIVLEVQMRKTDVVTELMKPLIRKPDEGPGDIKLLTWPNLLPLNDSVDR